MLHELRYAIRKLLRAPGFTAAAVTTLALGIGANATIFTVVNAILLSPPEQVAEPERLVAIFTSDFSGPPYGSSAIPDVEDFQKETGVFSGVTLFMPRPAGIGRDADLERVGLELVSDNYFNVLGVRPAVGRFFAPEEGRSAGAEPVAVISSDLWRRRFAADRGIIGKPVTINAQSFTVIGVAPEAFLGSFRGIASDLWVPVVMSARLGMGDDFTSRGNRGSLVLARLAPGVSLETARSRMRVVASQLFAAYPDEWRDVTRQGRRITVLPESETRVPPQIRGPALGFVALLMATVGLVLLICCANVASLVLARVSARAREIGVRLSLGAGRARIVRQLLTESVVLAVLGGAAGLMLAVWAGRALMAFQLPMIPIRVALDLSPDARVIAFTTGVALVTGVIFGLVPALRASRPDLVSVIKADAPAPRIGRRRLSAQGALVIGQVAMSMLLLISALLFIRSLRAASAIDPGFNAENVLLVDAAPRPGTERSTDGASVSQQIQQRVAALPGVRAATWADAVPLSLNASRRGIAIQDYRPRDGEDMEFHRNMVGPGYFELMEIPLVRGRSFTAADRAGAPGVVIVNEAFARRFWGDVDPLGKRISVSGPEGPWLEVVGLAKEGKYLSLGEGPRPYLYYPALQFPEGTTVHVRTAGDPHALLAAVRREIQAVAPDWITSNPRTLEEHIGGSLLPQRVAGAVLGMFSVVALLLASIGLYGVIAYSVARRTREIGVRVALGARRADVVSLVVRQGMTLVAIGILIGVPLAWGATRLLSAFLLGMSPGDPLAFLGATLLLGSVALLASYLPARRAAGVDPMIALRSE